MTAIRHIFIILLLGALYTPVKGVAQDSLTIQYHFDQFYDLEFEDLDKAKSHLDSGIALAGKLNQEYFLALGDKYTGWYYEDIFDLDSAVMYMRSAREKFARAGNIKEEANCYNSEGNLLSDQSKMEEAELAYRKSLELSKSINDVEGKSTVLNNMGVLYSDLGDYIKTVECYWEALKLFEEIGDDLGASDAWNNLGSAYSDMGDFDQALEYHLNAMEIREHYDAPEKKSSVYLNIGRVHLAQMRYPESREFFQKSIGIDNEIEDFDGVAIGYNNVGLAFFREGEKDSALKYYELSLEARNKTDDLHGYCLIYSNLGDYYASIKDWTKAEEYCSKSYRISKEHNFLYEFNAACYCLYEIKEKTGVTSEALNYLQEYTSTSDSIRAESKTKEVTKRQMEYQFYTKTLQDSLLREELALKKELEHEYELKEKIIEKEKADQSRRNQFWLFFVIVLALAINIGVYFNKYTNQKKQKEIIKEQKEVIEEKSNDIQQSIDYAKLIQSASLPEKQLSDLFEESFLMYRPKDVVSGDFYWLEDNEQYAWFAVADCTGHGIPGAFISLIGTILLNEIHNSKSIFLPNDILDELNRLVQLTLSQQNEGTLKDGMDISFCCLDKKSRVLHYSGANNPLWIISTAQTIQGKINNEEVVHKFGMEAGNGYYLHEIRADRQPVGKMYIESNPFTAHQVQLKEGDSVYLFSDGYADQFGGARGKKLKYKNMKLLFLEHVGLPMADQKNKIETAFDDWKNDFEQLDDVCVIGVKIK